jgi:hypothetical protein
MSKKQIYLHPKGSKFTVDGDLVQDNFTFIYIFFFLTVYMNVNHKNKNFIFNLMSKKIILVRGVLVYIYIYHKLSIPEDITDDTSLTLTHNSEQDINNVDHFSDVSESQSIDINSINLN